MDDYSFKKIIKNFPSIEVSLFWDNFSTYKIGRSVCEAKDMNVCDFDVITFFNIRETVLISGGEHEQSEQTFDSRSVSEISVQVYDAFTEENIPLSDIQEEQLVVLIESNIITS